MGDKLNERLLSFSPIRVIRVIRGQFFLLRKNVRKKLDRILYDG